MYGIFKFTKPKCKTFKRHTWDYEHGNYELLYQKSASFDWNSLHDKDIDMDAKQYNSKINQHRK